MRQAAVRCPRDGIKPEINAAVEARSRDAAIDGRRRIAELGAQIGGAVHAGRRHCGVEQKGAPHIGRPDFRTLREGKVEAALADVAPWADNVGIDLDLNGAAAALLCLVLHDACHPCAGLWSRAGRPVSCDMPAGAPYLTQYR